jgi:hypothetical protein
MEMLEFKINTDLRRSNPREFMSLTYNYLDRSGFTDIDCDETTIIAKKNWLSGGSAGTLSSVSLFHTAIVHTSDRNSTISFGTSRAFIAIVVLVTATSLAGLWWVPFETRVFEAAILAVVAYGIMVLQALLRTKIIFHRFARQCSGLP